MKSTKLFLMELFDYGSRIARGPFWCQWIARWTLLWTTTGFLLAFGWSWYQMSSDPNVSMKWMLYMVSCLLAFCAVMVMKLAILGLYRRRLHDFDFSGWWLLLVFIPGINIIMALVVGLKTGSLQANHYGEVPSGFHPRDLKRVLVCLLVFCIMVPIQIRIMFSGMNHSVVIKQHQISNHL